MLTNEAALHVMPQHAGKASGRANRLEPINRRRRHARSPPTSRPRLLFSSHLPVSGVHGGWIRSCLQQRGNHVELLLFGRVDERSDLALGARLQAGQCSVLQQPASRLPLAKLAGEVQRGEACT